MTSTPDDCEVDLVQSRINDSRIRMEGGHMPGHLFIVQGDLTRIACDAWLLPTSRTVHVRNIWMRGVPIGLLRRVTGSGDDKHNVATARHAWDFAPFISIPEGWYEGTRRSFEFVEWTTNDGANRPWPTDVVMGRWHSEDERARWLADGARQFVEDAAASLTGKPPAYGRARHLLALPVLGTGHGGGWSVAGTILRHLISVLEETVARLDVDVVLVTYTRDQFAAAQHVRRELIRSRGDDASWAPLPAALMKVSENLAEHSARGRLVLFLGAGVSRGAGLPDWSALLDELAEVAGFDPESRGALHKMPELDRASLLQSRLELL